MSVADLLDDFFESPEVLGVLSVSGVIGTWAGPRSPGTAFVMAHHKIGDVGDGALGAPDRAPFGAILVSATAEGQPPPALLDQLEDGGTLVCPVRRDGYERLVRFRDGEETLLASVRFVPLVTDAPT